MQKKRFAARILEEIMKGKFIGALLCLILTGCAKRDFVSVDALAYRCVRADKATVYFAVEGRGATSKEASAECEKLMEKVQSFTSSFESKESEAAIREMLIRPVYSYRDGDEKISAYLARMEVSADMKEASKTEDFIKGLTEVGVGSVERVVFFLSNKDEIEASLNEEAMKKARAIAVSLCEAEGRKAGKALSIEKKTDTAMYFADANREASKANVDASQSFESALINLESAITARFRIQ